MGVTVILSHYLNVQNQYWVSISFTGSQKVQI